LIPSAFIDLGDIVGGLNEAGFGFRGYLKSAELHQTARLPDIERNIGGSQLCQYLGQWRPLGVVRADVGGFGRKQPLFDMLAKRNTPSFAIEARSFLRCKSD
jgi:hypothetical protein